ncbi:MAG: hypothetical protein JNN30_10650 [Rhodanobacteraceae bacterium]|nr:hypothetical protein [Rhodanobacteraceae bacterium]
MTHRNHHEREFEAFLAGEESELARLYRRLPQSEPDAKLDAAVLAMARAAVEPQRVNALRHAKDRHRRPLWLVGLSSAAGIVLAAGLAWQMRGAYEATLPASVDSASPAARAERDVIPISAIVPEPPATSPPTAPASPATENAAPAMIPAPASPAPISQPSRPAPPAAKPAASRREAALAAASNDKKDQPFPAEAEAPREIAATEPAREAPTSAVTAASAELGKSEGHVDVAGASSSKARAQPFPGATTQDYNSVERKAAIASGTRRDDYGLDTDAISSDPRVKREERSRLGLQRVKEKHSTGQELAVTADAPAAAAPSALPQPLPPQDAHTPKPTEAQPSGVVAVDNSPNAELLRNARLAPEEWIKTIRELLRAERKHDAIENLELLRRLYPDYALPKDLRELQR